MRLELFIPCYVEHLRPAVGLALARLLDRLGLDWTYPADQTCCGQPAYNAGDRGDAAALAKQTIDALQGYDYVVAPSGSCAGMIKDHYPRLLESDPAWAAKARDLAGRTHELVSFLHDVLGIRAVDATFDGTVTYHDSCSGLRELGIKDQPRALLASVKGLTLVEAENTEVCCGFGGLFSVKYPDISGRMVDDKAQAVEATGAGTLLGGDMGCLMNVAGRLRRRGSATHVRHVAEVLAGLADAPAIAEGEDG